MAETMNSSSKSDELYALSDVLLDHLAEAPKLEGSLFSRKIEFHLARKPFSGFSNGGAGFRLETLNPSSSDSRAADGCGQSAPPGKKQDGPDFLDVGLDPELSFPITFKRIIQHGEQWGWDDLLWIMEKEIS
ncbi:unnamed protein product [Thlaspi arvense]|uniref:Uncharacterized protein n=1 Tax=Thlaspi arvense TaxID=13288 RepID=A0AAU9RG67_THLAR|nr:unnamed protein product [Thlaspi arvense]